MGVRPLMATIIEHGNPSFQPIPQRQPGCCLGGNPLDPGGRVPRFKGKIYNSMTGG